VGVLSENGLDNIVRIKSYAPAAWQSGHRVRLQNRRSRVRLPSGRKVLGLIYCCQNLMCTIIVCVFENNKCFNFFFKVTATRHLENEEFIVLFLFWLFWKKLSFSLLTCQSKKG
jgi:hypothetical protein